MVEIPRWLLLLRRLGPHHFRIPAFFLLQLRIVVTRGPSIIPISLFTLGHGRSYTRNTSDAYR